MYCIFCSYSNVKRVKIVRLKWQKNNTNEVQAIPNKILRKDVLFVIHVEPVSSGFHSTWCTGDLIQSVTLYHKKYVVIEPLQDWNIYIYFLNSCVSGISLNQLKRSKENNKSVHYTLLCLKYIIPCQTPYSKNFPRMSGINEFSEDLWTSVMGDFTYLCIHYHH